MSGKVTLKFLEVRDICTNITVFAFATRSEDPIESYHLIREGFCQDTIMMGRLETGETHYDPYDWDSTLFKAHEYLLEHFNELQTGDVIDVAFLNGRRDKPAMSERLLR